MCNEHNIVRNWRINEMHLKKKYEERDDHSMEHTSISYGSNMADNTREVRIEEQLKVKIGM